MLFLLTKDDVALIILAICILPILILMVFAIIIAIRRNRDRGRKRDIELKANVDDSQKLIFLNAFGGKDNIIDVMVQMSRVSVTVVDLEKVQVEELKEMGASGVLLVGNVLSETGRHIYINY
jgi:PTS system D-glucosamine-specific IIC component